MFASLYKNLWHRVNRHFQSIYCCIFSSFVSWKSWNYTLYPMTLPAAYEQLWQNTTQINMLTHRSLEDLSKHWFRSWRHQLITSDNASSIANTVHRNAYTHMCIFRENYPDANHINVVVIIFEYSNIFFTELWPYGVIELGHDWSG